MLRIRYLHARLPESSQEVFGVGEAFRRGQPIVAPPGGQAGDTFVGHVRVGEADQCAAAGQGTFSLQTPQPQQLRQRERPGAAGAVDHRLAAVGSVLRRTVSRLLHRFREG